MTSTDEQVPVIWMPEAYAVQAVSSTLANVVFNALGDLTPEHRHSTKQHGTRQHVVRHFCRPRTLGAPELIWLVLV